MEDDRLTFTLDGVEYRIDPHIWTGYPNRIGLITVERIMETIVQPDFHADETEYIRHYWKWFPEVGSGNYVKVIVNSQHEIRLVSTAHPDRNLRRRMRRAL